LCQIAKNTYFKQYGKDKHLAPLEGAPEKNRTENTEAKLIQKESAFAISRVLHRLEEPYKEVFSMRMFGELSFAEVAELFGKTESWARVTYHRAKTKIKEEMAK
jgi:RNA polymerase sigma-70 factor (ECF subfamily)